MVSPYELILIWKENNGYGKKYNKTWILKKVRGLSIPRRLIGDCFNKETTLNKDTKLVIIGTITPPKTEYFYCSYYNRIYGYIDEALAQVSKTGSKTLKELKTGLQEVNNSKVKISRLPESDIKKNKEQIKTILSKNGIAFLDVMEKVIRKTESPYDKDIKYYTLATSDFEDIKNKDGITFIENSKLAKQCTDDIGLKGVILLSQRRDTKKKWVNAISEAIK